MDFDDRLLLALEHVCLIFQRNSKISDDDVFDVADLWTTNDAEYDRFCDLLFFKLQSGV